MNAENSLVMAILNEPDASKRRERLYVALEELKALIEEIELDSDQPDQKQVTGCNADD